MNKKGMLLEFLLVIVLLVLYTIFVVYPDYKKSQGSSDAFIRSDDYENMIEIRINDQTDFAYILNSKEQVYHLFFFDNTSSILYNKNIEYQSIEKSIATTIPILIENQYLKNGDSVTILRASDTLYPQFQKSWDKIILQYSLVIETSEKVQTLEEKARELGMDTSSESSMLLDLDFYSKEFAKERPKEVYVPLTEESSKEYANSIYLKIEKMVKEKNITSLDKGEADIDLSLVPADSSHLYYPTSRSWYSVRDGKVYAFIEFQDKEKFYSYCYQGSIDLRVKGECES
ncbi:MAG: hypothetical protein J6X28_04150 [Bacilli bacterium]|nr:hypothetical protein [Bacilli bacterium]